MPTAPGEDDIMATWALLKGHIAHAPTSSSHTFTSGHESSSNSDVSGLSAASIQRRRVLKKRRTDEGPQQEPASQPPPQRTPAETSDVIASLLTGHSPCFSRRGHHHRMKGR